jgi:isopenicillin N synthase-like dioxygenase
MAVSAGIPLIDINSADTATIGRQLVDAAEEHGFIYIRNLGKDISPERIDEAFRLVCLSTCHASSGEHNTYTSAL